MQDRKQRNMESFLENLKQQVQCLLCNETLSEPKLLQCFHTFCKSCIKRHAQRLTEQVNIFKCPQCTSKTLLQELNGVEDLQISPVHSTILKTLSFLEKQKICSFSESHSQALWYCLECNQSLCEQCLGYHSKFAKNHQLVSLSDLKKEDIEIMVKRERPCKTHDNQDVDLYCQDCDMLICVSCWKTHHLNHKIALLQEFIANEKDVLSRNLKEIEKMSTNQRQKKQQEEIALLVKRDGEKATDKVTKLTTNLVEAHDNSEQELRNEIQKHITKADSNLSIIRHTTAAQEYIKCFIQSGTASEMIDTREGESFANFTYNPFETHISRMEFEPNEELCEQAKAGLGKLRLFKKADPKMSSINNPSSVEATKKTKLTIELKTSEGEVTGESLECITIQFTPEDDAIIGEIRMTDDSEITVDFIPRVAGQLKADIQVHGNAVSNSPLVVSVKPHQMKEMTGYSKLKEALNTGSKDFKGIAVNKTNNKIAVSDVRSHCVRVFNMEGSLLLRYGNERSEVLRFPDGLAFLNETDLVIADNANHRICILNTINGQMVNTFGSHGNGNGQFDYPYGVHVDDGSNIFVCDNANNRVQVFTKDGDYKYQFNVPNPQSVVTDNERFYVTESKSTSVVHVFEMKDNQSPTKVNTIGGKNYIADGQLQSPCGLPIDYNTLLVCKTDSFLIHKYTLDGRYVGSSNRLTHKPQYIAVLNDGQVICTTCRGGVIFFEIPIAE